MLGYLIHGITLMITVPHVSVDVIGLLLNSFSTLLLILYGEVNFKRLKNHGPYQVGYKEFRSAKFDNPVSVFYPISKQHYNEKIGTSNV
jgi:hypothetical protein